MRNKRAVVVDIKPEEPKRCPMCKRTHTVRHGFNVTKKRGRLPRRKCQDCGTTFYEDAGGE